MVRSGHLGEFLPFATEAVYFPLSAALLFLYCFADGKPKYINVDGTKYFYINNTGVSETMCTLSKSLTKL